MVRKIPRDMFSILVRSQEVRGVIFFILVWVPPILVSFDTFFYISLGTIKVSVGTVCALAVDFNG